MSRLGYVMVMYFAVMAIAIATFIPAPLRFVWNVSSSIPIGLYHLAPSRNLQVGDLVAVMPDEPLADFMAQRGYLGRDVPLMKHVAALPGQEVCRRHHTITVDAIPVGDALDSDRSGRTLPVWQGCRRLNDGQVFLLNSAVRDSLDGRYFGPLSARTIIGKATPIYTDETGSGHFVWRAVAGSASR